MRGRVIALWLLLGVLCAGGITAILAFTLNRNPGSSSIDYDADFCQPLIIAHRGASGYVPEHTLGAYALAVAMGSEYIEPDVVMTKDGHLIARHDNELGLTTDVAEHPQFATRYRTQYVDGTLVRGWFTEDFTLAEIKMLRAIERIPEIRPGNVRMDGSFEIPTMQEFIDLVKGMEISYGRRIGIYPEIKHSTHFQYLGLAMEKPLVDLLHENGYTGPEAPIYIQSFEVSNLKELSQITGIRLIQLLGGRKTAQPYDQVQLGSDLTYGDMATPEGLRDIARYAYAVGPEKSYIIPRDENNRLGQPTSFVRDAHAVNLKVHPYTFRAENLYLPAELQSDDPSPSAIGNFRGELKAFLSTGIDGMFSDQPDISVQVRGPCE